MSLEDDVPVRLKEREPAPFLGLEGRLVGVEATGDLGLRVFLDSRPVAVRDRDEEVPVGPAVTVEARRGGRDVEEAAACELLPEDRPVVLAATLNGDDPAGLRGDVTAALGGDAAAGC